MYDRKLDSSAVEWLELDFPGVAIKTLHQDGRSGGMTVLTRMQRGAVIPAHSHTHADETVYVLEGEFVEDGIAYGPGSFFVGAAGTGHGPHSTTRGCLLLTMFSGPLDFVLAEPA